MIFSEILLHAPPVSSILHSLQGEFTVNCRRREEDASLEVQNVVVVARSGGSAMDIPGEAM